MNESEGTSNNGSFSFLSTTTTNPPTPTTMAEKNEKKTDEPVAPAAPAATEKKKLPQLGALEDDDEFEVRNDVVVVDVVALC